uniref:WASP like actin nucleation promoting factor n=1 Tax=Scleropages formosus TaxID=113540 RepID=A0A8C9W7W3_SCLFO
MSAPQPRRVVNASSILLSPAENEAIFAYLGKKCSTLSSAVVQVFEADRSSSWVKRCCGVACLVKDNPQRSYFIRVLDLKDGKTMFEQELYNNFTINSPKPYFLSFAGDSCQVGMNFANEEEAKRFRATAMDLIGRRQRKTEKRRDPPNGPTLPMATVDIKNPEIHPRHHNSVSHSNFSKEKKKNTKGKRKKLTKADIGTPSNFQHIGHVGWDPNTGFDVNNLDPELKNLFDLCGISEAQLKDKETSKVIYDFIEKKGGVEAVKNELRRQGVCMHCFDSTLLLPLCTFEFEHAVTGECVHVCLAHEYGVCFFQVSESPEPAPPTPAPSAGIVGALMEVMQKRSKAIHSSDEDDDDDEDEDDDDDEEWED